MGDDVISGNQHVHIVHNYYEDGKSKGKIPPQYKNLKSELKSLLIKGKTADVFDRMLDLTEGKDEDAHNTVLLLSAQLNRLNAQETKGTLSNSEANIGRNRLNDALINVINGLEI